MGLADQIETGEWSENEDACYPCFRSDWCDSLVAMPDTLCDACVDAGWWCASCGDAVATTPHGYCSACQVCEKCGADLNDGEGGLFSACGDCHGGNDGDAWSGGFVENH